ncbi:hypothetical protein C6P45_003514 [Maudiozyma exigua]|uniref:Uncharacterized protein n=1 Tax=Maudiozyma exigua TaxID=34358 RepID=A0A9P7BAC5_MAUEX|nr:hypothetical protein C6P45_003514 [Kazachstania exigua]
MKPFQIKRINNESLDESFKEILHIQDINDNDNDKKLILGKYNLNSIEKSTDTLDVVQLDIKKDNFIVIEDRIVKEFKLTDNKKFKAINYYQTNRSIICCMKIESICGKLCLLMDNNDIIILDLKKNGFVHNKTITLDAFLMGRQLLPLLSSSASSDSSVFTLTKQKDIIIQINLMNDSIRQFPLQFKDLGGIKYFDCYRNRNTYNVLVFHVHKITNFLHLEFFQTNNYNENGASQSLFRKKICKIDKIDQDFLLLKKIEKDKYIVITLNHISLIKGNSGNIQRWTIGNTLKEIITQKLTNNVKLFHDENKNILYLKICDSYLRTISISCRYNESKINWKYMMDKTTNNPVQSMFFLKSDVIYIRDAVSMNQVAYLDKGKETNIYTVRKVSDKHKSKYEAITYHCALVRTNTGSIFQTYILAGTRSSLFESFIEYTNWKITPYKDIRKIGKLHNITGAVSKIVNIRDHSLMVIGETVYQFNHQDDNCNVYIQDLNPFEDYLTDNGNVITISGNDTIFCTDLANTISNTATEQDFLLTINTGGIVKIMSYTSQQAEYKIYYERKHHVSDRIGASTAYIHDSSVYLLLPESGYLRLYVNGTLKSETSIKGRIVRDCFIVQVDDDLTRGMVLLSLDYGKLILLDLTLKIVHFEITSSAECSYKLLKNVINHEILVAYQDRTVLFIDFKNLKTSILNVEMNIRVLSYIKENNGRNGFIIVDNSNCIHLIHFEKNLSIKKDVTRFNYNLRYDLPISIHELDCSDAHILLLSRNTKRGHISLDIMNIETGLFIPCGYNIPAACHAKICGKRLTSENMKYLHFKSCVPKDIFIVTYAKKENAFYEILKIDPISLTVVNLAKGKLKILPNFILIANATNSMQLVTFLGSGIETKNITYHLENSNTHLTVVSDLNYITGIDTFPFIGGEIDGEYIKTIDIRKNGSLYKIDTLELITSEVQNYSNNQILSTLKFPEPFIRQIFKTDLNGRNGQIFINSSKFSKDNLLNNMISSVVGEVTIPDRTIFASLDTNNEIILSQGMQELHEMEYLYQPSIHISHGVNIKNIIPIPDTLKFSDSSKNSLICRPLFIILGEASTCYIIVECPHGISMCHGVNVNDDMFSLGGYSRNYVHNNIYPNSSKTLSVQFLEFGENFC